MEILTWVSNHLGITALGVAAGSSLLTLLAPRLIKAGGVLLAKFLGKEIFAIQNLKIGNPEVDARVDLAILILMDVANRVMPCAPGADKKKYVLTFFSSLSPSLQAIVGLAIDQFWATAKDSIDRGVTVPQEAIIAEAIAKLQALQALPTVV